MIRKRQILAVSFISFLGVITCSSSADVWVEPTSFDVNTIEGTVLEEFQKGYKLNDRVIRPSKVAVNKLPKEEEDNISEDF